jgi:hypothetical protein
MKQALKDCNAIDYFFGGLLIGGLFGTCVTTLIFAVLIW